MIKIIKSTEITADKIIPRYSNKSNVGESETS